jgi:hypothetical protein
MMFFVVATWTPTIAFWSFHSYLSSNLNNLNKKEYTLYRSSSEEGWNLNKNDWTKTPLWCPNDIHREDNKLLGMIITSRVQSEILREDENFERG